MMHGADEEVGAGECQQGAHGQGGGGADPFAFEADQEGDVVGVVGAEALGFVDVGFVAGSELGDCVACCDLLELAWWLVADAKVFGGRADFFGVEVLVLIARHMFC